MSNFFTKYFLDPIIYKEGYNIVNTLAYSIIFIGFSILAFHIFKKLKIKIDYKLVIAIIPFILSMIIIRVLRDANIISGYLFVTPNIWLLSFFIIITTLSFFVLIEKNTGIPYYKPMFITGYIVFSFLLGIIRIENIEAFFYIIPFLFLLIVILFFLKTSLENKFVLGLQVFDSIVTAVSVEWFNYTEQHILPKLIIENTTPFSFIIVKFFIVYISLLIIDKHENKEFSNLIKLLIGILGLATGGRDFLRLLMNV